MNGSVSTFYRDIETRAVEIVVEAILVEAALMGQAEHIFVACDFEVAEEHTLLDEGLDLIRRRTRLKALVADALL